MRLEDDINFDKKYDIDNIPAILTKAQSIEADLHKTNPMMGKEWYISRSYRKIKALCETGYFNRDIGWDTPDNHKG